MKNLISRFSSDESGATAIEYGLIAAGTAMLFVGVRTFPPPYRPQYWAIIVGTLLPLIGNLLYLTRLRDVGNFDITPLTFALSGLCFTWGLYHHRLFGLVPVARDMVVDSMEDGVIILDAERRVVDLNAAAERYTGGTPASAGRDIGEVVSWWKDTTSEAGASLQMPAVIKTMPGPRYLEVRVHRRVDLDEIAIATERGDERTKVREHRGRYGLRRS